MSQNRPPENISLYSTPSQDCNYLSDKQSTSVYADPYLPKNMVIYSFLSEHGFRRSGEHIYRPQCEMCNACVATRVPVNNFHPNRNQRRTWKQNEDLTIKVFPAEYRTEHFELYQRYLSIRHANGGMDDPTPESYMNFLTCSWSETFFFEFRMKKKLVAVAVVDKLNNALSAVYTFFDPDLSHRSLGKFSILYTIEYASQSEMKWLYLGYWIEECQKMKYKQEYQPQEHFKNHQWIKE